MPRLARFTSVLLLGAALVLVPAGAATAQDLDDFEIQSFDADWVLTRDADGHAHLRVTETIVAVYPPYDQNKGFYRDIPEYRHGVQLHTQLESVLDERGRPVPFTTEYYEDFFSVGLGDDSYVHGRQTYVITYEQVDVVEAFADTGADEFYWDVNGTGWAQPFGRASVELTVDPGIAPLITGDASCYTFGDCDGSLETGGMIAPTANADGSVTYSASATDLAPNESLTISVPFELGSFEPGTIVIPPSDDPNYEPPVPEPPFWDTFGPFILGGGAILTSLVAGATQVADRSRRAGPSDIIVPQYTPPDGLNVMVAAYIAGRPERAFAAQIVDLAVRGNVRLLDHPADSTAPFEVELLHANNLDELETKLMQAVFGSSLEPGGRRALGSSNTTLGTNLLGVYTAIDTKLKGDGYQGPARPTVLWSILFFLAIATTIVAGFDTLRRFAADEFPVLAGGATFVAFVCAQAVYRARATVATLSTRGREQNNYLLGMRDYMQLAEEDRIRYLQSPEGAERVAVGRPDVDDRTAMVKLYERLLPFAVIFGIEDKWAGELTVKAAAAAVPVTWWSGSSDFSSWRLNSTIQSIRQSTPAPPRPLVAKTRSSSSGSGWGGWGSGGSSGGWSGSSGSSFSGGSSGGGFSGGGGGGGGGRGR
jgi:hypothetical protein